MVTRSAIRKRHSRVTKVNEAQSLRRDREVSLVYMCSRIAERKKYAPRGGWKRAHFNDEYYDYHRNVHTSHSGFSIGSIRLSPRRVASAKFHYRSPAINIINWAVLAPRTGPRNFAHPFFPPSSTRSSRRSHSPRGELPNEYILVRLPVSCFLTPSPSSFLSPPR